MKNKKTLKIIALTVGIVLAAGVLYIYNEFAGNPISKHMAKKAAAEYAEANYPDLDVQLSRVSYSFKDGNYYAYFKSPNSVDTAFTVYIDKLGKPFYDSYESDVSEGLNIFRRLDGEFRKIGESLLKGIDGNIENCGILMNIESLNRDNFYLDMPADIKNPPAPIGAFVYLYKGEVSYEKAADLMLKMDEACSAEEIYPDTFTVYIRNDEVVYTDENGDEAAENKMIYLIDVPREILKMENLPAVLEELDNK